MKRFGILGLVLLLALCLVIKPVTTGADLGDFSGGSDYGGSDWSSSSDWDSSSSWSSGSGYYTGSSGSDAGSMVMGFIICLIILAVVIARDKAKNGSSSAARPTGARRTDDSQLRPMSAYSSIDPEFSEQRLTENLSNIYVQMQNCCTDKDITPLRPYFTDPLYQQFDRQITGLKQRGETNYVERIAVLGVTLRGFCRKDGEDHIIAEIKTRITDYTLRDSDGTLISGDRKAEKFMVYEYDLSRPSGTLTEKQAAATQRHCPNCGAPLSINESAKCPYCDMVVTFKEHDWVICSIKGISQRTVK